MRGFLSSVCRWHHCRARLRGIASVEIPSRSLALTPWGLRLMRAPSHARDAADNASETEPKGNQMKIVVIGGTGLIGSKLVTKLRADGHDPLAASPATGVDIITGKGLAEALAGAHVVVDVSNAPNWGDAEVMEFFQTSARNILA